MIKLVYCITRRHGMALEEFSRYWREVHGPIGRRIPGLRRLVQSHPTRQPADLSPPPFDGPPICVTTIGVATWPRASSGFLFVRLKTTDSLPLMGL